MLRVATWNVLHRIHAVNWSEPAITAHVDEDVRVAAIAARVAELARDRVVALQEVSGDQLVALRAAIADREVLSAPYPRVPSYKLAQTAVWPRDRQEYLVVIAPREDVVDARPYAFPNDGGKGFLAVQLASGTLVVGAHVGWGEKRVQQLAAIRDGVLAHGGPAVLLGDFNADRDVILADLGAGFVAGVPAPGLSTRPRIDPREKSEHIDHVIAYGATVEDAAVASANGLSDHNIVTATVR